MLLTVRVGSPTSRIAVCGARSSAEILVAFHELRARRNESTGVGYEGCNDDGGENLHSARCDEG